MKRTLVLFLGAALLSVGASAQKMKLVSGKLGFLKTTKIVAVTYDYSTMGVGKFKNEEDYLDKKTAEYNEKEAGRGDQWAQSWKNDRATRFEPKFEELLNQGTKKLGVTFGKSQKSDVVMNVKTTFTEPGYNVYVSRKPAIINLEITFTQGGSDLAKITLIGAPGATYGGYDFDTGVRIAEAYAKAGKSLGAFLTKSVSKIK